MICLAKHFFSIILIPSYLGMHGNSTDKIEIEEHCTLLLKYKIQSKAQNQSRLDIHQVHPEQKKNYIHQLHQVESATIAGLGGAKKVAKQFCSITAPAQMWCRPVRCSMQFRLKTSFVKSFALLTESRIRTSKAGLIHF